MTVFLGNMCALTEQYVDIIYNTTNLELSPDTTFSLPKTIPQLWQSADTDISQILCFTLEQILIIKYM